MKLKNILVAGSMLLMASALQPLYGQMYGSMIKTTLLDGSFKALKGEKVVDVQFEYDGMIVGDGMTNDQYVTKKTKEYNAKDKGRGDTWAVAWVEDRERLYHPKFLELYNKTMSGAGQNGGTNMDGAKYRLIVKTVRCEPGYNIGISKRPSMIGANVRLVAVDDPETTLGEIVVANCPGANAMGFDYDTGGRIAEAYAKLGKEVASWISKKGWK